MFRQGYAKPSRRSIGFALKETSPIQNVGQYRSNAVDQVRLNNLEFWKGHLNNLLTLYVLTKMTGALLNLWSTGKISSIFSCTVMSALHFSATFGFSWRSITLRAYQRLIKMLTLKCQLGMQSLETHPRFLVFDSDTNTHVLSKSVGKLAKFLPFDVQIASHILLPPITETKSTCP